jgi:hypothetical protein
MVPLLGGLAISLTMSLLLALVIYNLLSLVLDNSILSFTGWTALFLLGVVGLVVWRVRTPLESGPINGLAVGPELAKLRRSLRYYTPGVKAESITGIDGVDQALFGPRLMVSGLRQLTGRDDEHRRRFFVRCAQLLHKLASVGESVTIDWLKEDKHEPITVVEHAVDYLERHDWVGANSMRLKIWLSAQAKQILPFMGVHVKGKDEI